MPRQHPVGKAQQTILNALSLEADNFQEAEKLFEDRGLIVVPVRRGRKSVPQIYLAESTVGGFNADGEGEASTVEFEPVNLSLIKEWLV